MNMEDVILVATVREEIRDGALRVDVADIPRCVEAAQAGKLNRPVGDKIYRGKQQRETTERIAFNDGLRIQSESGNGGCKDDGGITFGTTT
jgi:hypothetical protein